MMNKIRNTTGPIDTNVAPTIPTKLREFTVYYFEKFRIKKVSEQTYVNDEYRLKNHIFPYLGERELSSITPSDCETLINRMLSAGKTRTAQDLFSLLSIIFKGAIAHGIMHRNPLDIVPRVRHERQHGKALSAQEEFELFQRAHGTPYEIFYAIILYCGLRPNELKTVRIEGAFIVARNSKRKNQKIEYKKIPICKKLAPYLNEIGNDLTKLDWRAEKTLSQRFANTYCPGHKLYDLRTTFYTRCKELGVADSARDAFVGHSLGVLGNSYTDLSDSYLLKEGKKLNKW
jgi:integrase